MNRLKTVTNWLGQTATYNYDDTGRLTSLVNFNGTVTTYGYDNANRLTTLENKKSDTTTILASYSFTLDANGNRTQVVQNEPLTLTLSTDTVSYTYNTQKNRLLTANTISFGYDNEGQLSTGYSTAYTFDYEHRLKTIGSTIQFYYDGGGRRLKAIRGAETTKYIYDAGGNLLAEADGNNIITKYYIHGLGLMAMVTPANQVYTYHFNAVGSTIAMTDSTQTIVNKYSYDPFGNIAANSIENVPQPFKFVGQYGVMTEPNGFYYMRARYYDPEVGRFISEDPIGFDGGDVNLCAYAGNNPVNRIDPFGLEIIYNNYKISDYRVHLSLISLDSALPYSDIIVTGGDRYIDNDGKIRSSSNNQLIPHSAPNSTHLYGIAVDFKISNMTPTKEFISNYFDYVKNDYSDNHIHGDIRKQAGYGMQPML